jgi:hypothetical protein
VKQAIGDVVNDGSDNTSQGPSTAKQVTIHAPFSLPTTWATLTKNEGIFNEISDWAQQKDEGMHADAVSDADCGGDPRMSDSNTGNNREKGVKRSEGVNRPAFRGTKQRGGNWKSSRLWIAAALMCGERPKEELGRKGQEGAGQGIEDLNAGRGFSYRMPPITRDQIRARGTAVSCFIVVPSGKLCYNIQVQDLCPTASSQYESSSHRSDSI